MSDEAGEKHSEAGATGQGAEVSVRIADLPSEATSARAFASLIAAWPEPEPATEPAPVRKPRNGALSRDAIRRIADRAEQASAKRR